MLNVPAQPATGYHLLGYVTDDDVFVSHDSCLPEMVAMQCPSHSCVGRPELEMAERSPVTSDTRLTAARLLPTDRRFLSVQAPDD